MNSTAQKTRVSTREVKKSWKARENDACIPIPVEPIPTQTKPLLDNPMPAFEPKFRVPYQSMRSAVSVDDYLELFLCLFGESNLALIVASTNAKADCYAPTTPSPRPRPWKPLTRNELIVWIGVLFYMGRHYEINEEDYWKPDIHHLGKYMSKTRWEQIHKFLTINIEERLDGQPWHYKLEPLASVIRSNLQKACYPASWLAVDEMMIKFTGRSRDTTKVLKKPIKEGFKMWCLGFKGYIYSFRYYSGKDSGEGISKPAWYDQHVPLKAVQLASTQQVSVVLCREIHALYPKQQFLCFLDNLFLNVEVAHCLLAINIAVCGTTRKNAEGVPKSLLAAKDDDSKLLVWNSVIAVILEFCLCFLWQDNNAVIVITTAHSIHWPEDKEEVLRHRPKPTSTNAAITRPIFEGQSTKYLDIPKPINDYNHGMGGVDEASHLRVNFSCHKPYEKRWWRPILYWLLDICINNAYLLWKLQKNNQSRRLHETFFDDLVRVMLNYDPWTPAPGQDSCLHEPVKLQSRQRCA